MELRDYWTILRRRWWLPILLALLVGAISAGQLRPWQAAPPTYNASLQLLVSVLPPENADATTYDPYYFAALTSEYLVDDLSELVRGELFARAVSQRLAAQGIDIPAGAISGSSFTGDLHRFVNLTITWPDAAQAQAIISAAADEIEQDKGDYLRQLAALNADIVITNGPTVAAVGPGLRSQIDLPLRVLLALMVGIGLVFLLDYLDASVRDRREVERMGFVVLGEIPKK